LQSANQFQCVQAWKKNVDKGSIDFQGTPLHDLLTETF
jgi:hypothetical protein